MLGTTVTIATAARKGNFGFISLSNRMLPADMKVYQQLLSGTNSGKVMATGVQKSESKEKCGLS